MAEHLDDPVEDKSLTSRSNIVNDDIYMDSGRGSPLMTSAPRLSRQAIEEFACIASGNDDVTTRHIHRATESLLVLQQSIDTAQLLDGLRQLEACLRNGKRGVVEYLEDNQAQLAVISVMRHVQDSVLVQQLGVNILAQMRNRSSKLHEALIVNNVYSFLAQVLGSNTRDALVNEHGMALLTHLLAAESVRTQIVLNKSQGNIAVVVCSGIITFQGTRSIEMTCIQALAYLISIDDIIFEYDMTNALIRLAEVLHSEEEPEVQNNILHIFACVSKQENYRILLVKKDAHFTMVELCRKMTSNHVVMSGVVELLVLLNKEESVQNALSSNGFVQKGLFSYLEVLRLNERVQDAGLQLIEALVPRLLEDNTNADDLARVLIRTIHTAMFTHIDKPNVQIAGCRCLVALVEQRPEALKWIGDNSDEKQEPVYNLCLGAMMVFRKNVDVFISACEVVYWVAADNERLCTLLMRKNVHVAIVEGLKRHRKISKAVEVGCQALRGLCIFLYRHKKAVVDDDIFSLLADLQVRYAHDESVQIEVISIIACLADIDLVRYQSFVGKVPEKIVASMTRFEDAAVIHEAGLEAFAVLAGAEGGTELLISAGALQITLDVMLNFQDNPLITKKGFIALQLFAGPNAVRDNQICKTIGTIVCAAMKTFADVKSILSEVCVTIQLFAETSSEMSKEFVDIGCHEFLFSLLEDTDPKIGLQELASECLYVLSQEQNLKSVMLLSACRSGMVPATECLIELGADVNIGEGQNTPLCLAVSSNSADVVKLLLKHDVQDLSVPLSQSLQQQSHIITGLILQLIGFDRNSWGICWTGQGLCSLEASWIITSLTNNQIQETDTDIGHIGHYYFDKIKSSEGKRKNRRSLTYSKSDTSERRPFTRLRHTQFYEREREMNIADMRPRTPKNTEIEPPFAMPKVKSNKINRSQSFDGRTSSSATIHSAMSCRPALPTILTINPTGDTDIPVFDLSPTEADEWKQNTLTGANVSYSPNDPRMTSPNTKRRDSFESSTWIRKQRSKSPRLSNSSISSIEDVPGSPYLGLRKMSAPVLSGVEHFKLSRKLSIASISEAESIAHIGLKPTLLWMDLSENKIETVVSLVSTNLMGHLEQLEKLDLCGNNISELPEDLYKNLPNLQVIDVTCNKLDVFPDTLLQCQHLKELKLSNNKIKEIQLCHFNSSLKKLHLSNNHIKALPNGIGNYLHNLRELFLNNNDLIYLPETSLGLKELKTLDLSHNQIDCMPNEFLHMCARLETLDLSYNILNRLPNESLSTELPKLTKLKLRRNHLAEKHPFYIPRFILELPSIRSLDISENQLTGLPSLSMWVSTVMKDFLASKNKIANLNLENAKQWSKIEKLHLAHNELSELPREIGQLASLNSLDISYNKNITTLPDELGKCSKIYEMPTDGLDLDLDRGLMKRRVKDIISFLHNRLKKAQRYYRMKLMVVGYGGRGKTTLLSTLMKKSIKKRENKPTVGVVVQDWKYIRFDRRTSEADIHQSWLFGSGRKVEYTLNTWDFAGQEEFYSTHNCYLSNRAVYLVVFDVRRGVSDVNTMKSWLASIRSRAPSCPVIVVGTHLDRLPRDKNKCREETNRISEKLRELNRTPGFPTISAIYLVDASCENENIDSLRNGIKKIVDTFEIRGKRVMGEKIPASYVRLSDMLLEKARAIDNIYPVIKHRELQQMVQAQGLDLDEDELQQAVRFMHESGTLLHYEDASLQLRDFYFIDPGWLCRMMAQVITVRQINPFISKDGTLRKKDIDILFKENYHLQMNIIPQYIKLLEKFEIALPHSDTELLIPCRLSSNRPPICLPACKNETISRIYRMPYVPIGLWFRLIARMISLTTHVGFRTLLKLSQFPKKVCWRKGLYVFWSEIEFFLLDSSVEESHYPEGSQQTESIHITVPSSGQGYRILGQIVDHLDNLIDEWYPGLTSIDPLMGQEILEVLSPCRQCTGTDVKLFTLCEIQKTASEKDYIQCPNHKGNIPLVELAPDLVLGDIGLEFKLDTNSFEFEESSDKQLGDGGFGEVYSGKYKNKDVAVKLFKEIADIQPLTMLRQEATILRCLKHPSVVSLVAVGLRPPVVVLELAAFGTLGHLIKAGKGIQKGLQHRIALQVAEGLVYLQSKMIVFRDMKPDNVLIFNTALSKPINAKISDYGIARFTSFQGLRAQEGTLAYRAPEVIRKENYSFQADIFSYGMTMYAMQTGHHPFDYLDSKSEMDRAVADCLPIPRFESKTMNTTWPDMQVLTMRCLNYSPDDRPDAKHIFDILRRSDVYGLQRVVPISKSTTVECFAIESTYKDGKQDLRLWVASGDSDSNQLSYIYLNDASCKTKGQLFNHGRILCMQAIKDHYLILGTQIGFVWVFDTNTCQLSHSSADLRDSPLCMKYMKGDQEGGWFLVGLANGKVAIFPLQELLNEPDVDPVCLSPGNDKEPVSCMAKLGRRVFLSCGTQLVILHTGKGITIERIVETVSPRNQSAPVIYRMAVLKGQIIFSKKQSSTVEIWDASKEMVERSFKVEDVLGLPAEDARVTALAADNKAIWVGTHSGHIVIVDVNTFGVLAITHRYMTAVRSLVYVSHAGVPKYKAVFSGGLGFKEQHVTNAGNKRSMCGCVLIWDADFPQFTKMSAEYERKRHELKRQPSEENVHDGDDEEEASAHEKEQIKRIDSKSKIPIPWH